jgi:N-sulfoglucosamine sulfohydrolase
LAIAFLLCTLHQSLPAIERPNILIAISDDQSWPHASAYGATLVKTPGFDRIAKEGVLFNNAFCGSPGCSPSRAALLTGRHTWQIEHAGTHASYFPARYETFPDRLEQAGYFVGYTGKGWGPGDFKSSGRTRNPAGTSFSAKRSDTQSAYVASFAQFMTGRAEDQPFYFWFGSHDAHRGYKKGSGLAKGMTLAQAEVPNFLPDTPEIRSDLLDYAFEVERFDDDLSAMLKILEEKGELDNTLVIVTSDNGMPFPRAKANCYEYGIHMPLAIRWPQGATGGRTVDDLVGFVDLTATIYDATNVEPPPVTTEGGGTGVVGRSIMNILGSNKSGIVDESRDAVYSARERHSSSRYNSLSYPQRCIRTQRFLYIRNFTPERWPAGTPQKYARVTWDAQGDATATLGPIHGGYHDIDACPALDFLIEHRDHPQWGKFLGLSVDKRPAEELFDIQQDPDCMQNLAGDPKFATEQKELSTRLIEYLTATGDARVTGNGDVWETYPRVSSVRWFPEPAWLSSDPAKLPTQPWLEKRRPKK